LLFRLVQCYYVLAFIFYCALNGRSAVENIRLILVERNVGGIVWRVFNNSIDIAVVYVLTVSKYRLYAVTLYIASSLCVEYAVVELVLAPHVDATPTGSYPFVALFGIPRAFKELAIDEYYLVKC
jgi:hypothetical protein